MHRGVKSDLNSTSPHRHWGFQIHSSGPNVQSNNACPSCKLNWRALTSHRTEHREGFMFENGFSAWHYMWDQLYCTDVGFWFNWLCYTVYSTVWIWCNVFALKLEAFHWVSSSNSPSDPSSDPSSDGEQSSQNFNWSFVLVFCGFGVVLQSWETFADELWRTEPTNK